MNFLTSLGDDLVKQSECDLRGVDDEVGVAHDGALDELGTCCIDSLFLFTDNV